MSVSWSQRLSRSARRDACAPASGKRTRSLPLLFAFPSFSPPPHHTVGSSSLLIKCEPPLQRQPAPSRCQSKPAGQRAIWRIFSRMGASFLYCSCSVMDGLAHRAQDAENLLAQLVDHLVPLAPRLLQHLVHDVLGEIFGALAPVIRGQSEGHQGAIRGRLESTYSRTRTVYR